MIFCHLQAFFLTSNTNLFAVKSAAYCFIIKHQKVFKYSRYLQRHNHLDRSRSFPRLQI